MALRRGQGVGGGGMGMLPGEGVPMTSEGMLPGDSPSSPASFGSPDFGVPSDIPLAESSHVVGEGVPAGGLRSRPLYSDGSFGGGGMEAMPAAPTPSSYTSTTTFEPAAPAFPPTSFGSDSAYGADPLNMRNEPRAGTPARGSEPGIKAPLEMLVDAIPTEKIMQYMRPYLPRQLRNTSVDELLNTFQGDDSRLFNSHGRVGKFIDRTVFVHAILLAISVGLMAITYILFDNFWEYEFFYFDPFALFYYWWVFFWGGALSAGVWHFKGKKSFDEKQFITRTINGLLVAVAEELGFRWAYVFVTMLVFSIVDVVIAHVGLALGFLMVIGGGSMAMAIGLLVVFKENQVLSDFLGRYNPKHLIFGCLTVVAIGIPVAVVGWFAHSIAYTVWEYLLIPILDLITLYTLSPLWKGFFGRYAQYGWAASNTDRFRRRPSYMSSKRYPEVFVHAMMLVQLFYSDGRKYEGIVGIVNSWLIGLVFLSCTLHYGLITAIVLHLLWNLEFAVVGYFVQKSGWIRAGGVPHGVTGILGGL